MLRQIWQRWFGEEEAAKPGEPDRQNQEAPELDGANREALFAQVLEAAAHDWNEAQLEELLKNLSGLMTAQQWAAWLREYGQRLLAAPEPDEEIALKLVKLSQVGCGFVGEVAGEVGRRLLAEKHGIATSGSEPLDPETEGWFMKGNKFFHAGAFEKAIACWDKAIALKADFHQAWTNRGLALNSLGRYQEALDSYDRALTVKPEFYAALLDRGVALKNLGRYEAALACYEHALTLQPDSHLAFANRGVVLGKLGRIEEALESYDRAIALEAKRAKTWVYRGQTLMDIESYLEAIASFDEALEIKPQMQLVWILRGKALYNIDRFAEAILSFDKALDIGPDQEAQQYRRDAIDILKERSMGIW